MSEIIVPIGQRTIERAQPGDVFVVSGLRDALLLSGLKGTEEDPITVIGREARIVTGAGIGLRIENCQYLKVVAEGTFSIQGASNAGVHVRRGTEYVEIAGLEISDTRTGMRVHTSVEAVPTGWVQHDTYIHHCYIHDVVAEAMYIGKGTDQRKKAAPLEDLRVAHCRIERCGWDGIQTRNARFVRVWDNLVRDCGADTAGTSQGGAGLIIGSGTAGRWHNNEVDNADRGIMLLHHLAGVQVDHNLLVHCGYVRDQGGIYQFTGEPATIHHNTIVGSNVFAIRVKTGARSEIRDHLIVHRTDSAIRADGEGVHHNLVARSMAEAGLTDDYHLLSGSPAIGAASDGGDVGAFPYEPSPEPPPEPPPPELGRIMSVTIVPRDDAGNPLGVWAGDIEKQ